MDWFCLVAALMIGYLLGYFVGSRGVRVVFPPLLGMLLAAPTLASPIEAMAAALTDAKTQPAAAAVYVRYFDCSHMTPDGQIVAAKVLAYHLNSLSRESDIAAVRSLAGGAVLAIDLRDFGLDPKTWEKLADPETKEPYFHVLLETTEDYQRPTQPGYAPYPVEKRKAYKIGPAPWLSRAGVDELYALTKSAVPIVRADWFFFQTAVHKDRHVGYYDWLGVGKKEADFLKLIGANAAEAKRLKLEMAASVARSGVAIHNRGITRLQSLTGGYWSTSDYKTSVDRQNVARLLQGDTEPPNGDASEQYGVLSNGLFAYWLQDAAGNRQDVVPPDIALDHKSTGNDRNIYAGTMSCTRCHTEGLRPIDDFARGLFKGPVQLKSPDYEKFKRLRQLYLTDLPGQQAQDNARFAAAVKQANGLSVAENSRLVAEFWSAYLDEPVTPAIAASELGCTEAHLLKRAAAYIEQTAVADSILAAFAQNPPIPVRREQFEEMIPQFYRMVGDGR